MNHSETKLYPFSNLQLLCETNINENLTQMKKKGTKSRLSHLERHAGK